MSEYYESTNDVGVTIYEPTHGYPWGEVRTYTYPDGSVVNNLDADELREVAQMLEDAADELEETQQ